MNLTVSLALLAAFFVLLCRGRGEDAIPIFRNWIYGMLFSVALLYLFAAGLMGALVNLNWLR